MKLTCDLCGGALQMNLGGQDAACKTCGLVYPLERLREKLSQKTPTQPKQTAVEPKQAVVEPKQTVVEPKKVVVEPKQVVVEPKQEAEVPVIQQFVMQVEGVSGDCLVGCVQQGSIGIGECVYVNHDYANAYRIYHLGDDSDVVCVKPGMRAKLHLVSCPKKVLRNAQVLTGNQLPVENAYNFPGSVDAYFASLLQRKFPEYAVQTQVAWEGLKLPVSYLLLQNGTPAVAVFVFDSHDAKARYQTEKAVTVFQQAGIGCTHFFRDYRNDLPYVVDRIRSAMGR